MQNLKIILTSITCFLKNVYNMIEIKNINSKENDRNIIYISIDNNNKKIIIKYYNNKRNK